MKIKLGVQLWKLVESLFQAEKLEIVGVEDKRAPLSVLEFSLFEYIFVIVGGKDLLRGNRNGVETWVSRHSPIVQALSFLVGCLFSGVIDRACIKAGI